MTAKAKGKPGEFNAKFQRGAKLSVDKVNLSKMETGDTLRGFFRGIRQSEPFLDTNPDTGEVTEKRLNLMYMDYLPGEGIGRYRVIADKGLIGHLTDANAKDGDALEIEKMPKVDIGKNRTMNDYEVFKLVESK
jgi:hypothetical protein